MGLLDFQSRSPSETGKVTPVRSISKKNSVGSASENSVLNLEKTEMPPGGSMFAVKTGWWRQKLSTIIIHNRDNNIN